MRETKYNKLHGHKLMVAQRRDQLMQMISVDPDRKWSVRDMANEARKLEWFQENQPTYSKTTAHKDYIAVMDNLKKNLEGLASYYIETHLTTTDDMIDKLQEDLEVLDEEYEFSVHMINMLEDKLGEIDSDDHELYVDLSKQISDYVKTKKALRKERRDIHATILSIMRRQSTLVPIQVPFEQKGVNVQVNNLQLSIDDFQREKAKLKQQQYLEIPSTVEGDYEEIEEDRD